MSDADDGVDNTLPYSIFEFGVVLLVVLFIILAGCYVLRHHFRLHSLCLVRVLLCFSLACWVMATLVADVSFWEVVVSITAWQPRTEAREILCEVYVVASFGFLEPMVLALIGGLFHRKSLGGAVTDWRPRQLMLRAVGFALFAALLQAALLVLVQTGVVPEDVLGPRPPTGTNYTSWDVDYLLYRPPLPPLSPPLTPPPAPSPGNSSGLAPPSPVLPPVGGAGQLVPAPLMPPMLPLPPMPPMPPMLPPSPPAPPAAPPRYSWWRREYSWWRREGCASSYGTFAVSALVFICFEVLWTLACQRLIRTVVNQRMRWRLRAVQATFMCAPVLLLAPRALLIFVPAGWYLPRRLIKTAEIAATLVATVVAVVFLVVRPVREEIVATRHGSSALELKKLASPRIDQRLGPRLPAACNSPCSTDVMLSMPRAAGTTEDPTAAALDAAHDGATLDAADGAQGGATKRHLLHLVRRPPAAAQYATKDVVIDLDGSPISEAAGLCTPGSIRSAASHEVAPPAGAVAAELAVPPRHSCHSLRSSLLSRGSYDSDLSGAELSELGAAVFPGACQSTQYSI
jgi:hypothetical protein